MRAKVRARLTGLLLRLVIPVAVLVFLVAQVGTGGFADAVRVLRPDAIAAALALGFGYTALSALRWAYVARLVGLPLGFRPALAAYYRASFLNGVLPTGVAGDIERAVRHGRETDDLGRGARAVILERTAGQAALLITTAVALVVKAPGLPSGLRERGEILVLAASGVLVLLTVLVLLAGRIPRLRSTVADLRAVVAPRAWPVLLGLSVGALACYIGLFLVAARATGATAPTLELIPLLLLALLAMALPVSLAGWGPREATAAAAFGAAGLSASQGVAVAAGYGLLVLVAALPGAAVLAVGVVTGVRRGTVGRRRAEVELEEGVVAEPEPAHGRA